MLWRICSCCRSCSNAELEPSPVLESHEEAEAQSDVWADDGELGCWGLDSVSVRMTLPRLIAQNAAWPQLYRGWAASFVGQVLGVDGKTIHDRKAAAPGEKPQLPALKQIRLKL
jgi:hypothetical protein